MDTLRAILKVDVIQPPLPQGSYDSNLSLDVALR